MMHDVYQLFGGSRLPGVGQPLCPWTSSSWRLDGVRDTQGLFSPCDSAERVGARPSRCYLLQFTLAVRCLCYAASAWSCAGGPRRPSGLLLPPLDARLRLLLPSLPTTGRPQLPGVHRTGRAFRGLHGRSCRDAPVLVAVVTVESFHIVAQSLSRV